MQNFEGLGTFYLGREVNRPENEEQNDLLLYDSKDLTTHAVVVGMTGSGKTGLCLGLLEEAGLDRIPAIVIDPKGDIANLLLTFPDLQSKDFRPWVDEGQAAREGVTPDEFAAAEATKWKKGLEKWGQDGERIRKLRDSVEMRVYTPGSNAGRPLTILKSFSVPAPEVLADSDALRERISSATSGLLALLGINADPIRSREHILISNIFNHWWCKGKDLDLAQLISEIQNPPFERVGIMDLDSFFPSKDRLELAMTLNNLLASPSFSSWMTGEQLDIKRLLHTDSGKPCISILSIAHLSEKERMFFVTIVLNEILSWMRTQAGTSSLRAMLYMDEVFGYFPPVKNPPSKQPMLTLLKQARAYGLGVVLATQNPVDLDYKGLSNTGTWFLGRLQTERDKARVLEGLEGAAAQTGAAFDRGSFEQILAGLGSRKFLMNNVHEDEPVIFETRWAMSYLRGPLTRRQIQKLVNHEGQSSTGRPSTSTTAAPRPEKIEPVEPEIDPRQQIPSDIEQVFIEPTKRIGGDERIVYRPAILGHGRLHFVRASYKVDEWTDPMFLATVSGNNISNDIWAKALEIQSDFELIREPLDTAEFAQVSTRLGKSKSYSSWEKELKKFLYREQATTIWKCSELKKYSTFGESQGDFKVRLEQFASEKRDAETEKLRKKYASKYQTLRNRMRRAEDKIESEEAQYKQSRLNSYLSMGTSIMGALLGRKTVSATNARRAGTSMRAFGRASKEKDDIGRAQDKLEDLNEQYKELESEFEIAVQALDEKHVVENLEFEEFRLPPRKSDISIEKFAVCWVPWIVDSAGIAERAF